MVTAPHGDELRAESRRWFEDALFAGMEAAGEQPVTSHPGVGVRAARRRGTTLSELACRIGVARQTAHQVVHALIGMHLLEQVPDPGTARRILIRTTAEGRRVHEGAQATIAVMESVLADRIGATAVDALRQTPAADWGEPRLIAAP
ncbi:winged helix DNA-binding protein [Streptomyces sp. SLBN-31]|nr:winged helix DNA-binding protein [Streptomyces sp. SLBN-31]